MIYCVCVCVFLPGDLQLSLSDFLRRFEVCVVRKSRFHGATNPSALFFYGNFGWCLEVLGLSDNDEFIYSATVDMNARCGTEDKLSLLRIPLWSALGHVDINLDNNSYCSFRLYSLKKLTSLQMDALAALWGHNPTARINVDSVANHVYVWTLRFFR